MTQRARFVGHLARFRALVSAPFGPSLRLGGPRVEKRFGALLAHSRPPAYDPRHAIGPTPALPTRAAPALARFRVRVRSCVRWARRLCSYRTSRSQPREAQSRAYQDAG